MFKHLALLLPLTVAACATNEEKFSDNMEFEPVSGVLDAVKSTEAGGSTSAGEIEWYGCSQGNATETFVLLNSEGQPFGKDSCTSPIVQAFLSEKYNVLALNRPGQGKSKGKELIGDDASLKALSDAVKELGAKQKIKGLWAFEEASVIAFRLAKAYPFESIIIGNGIFDWEATLQESPDPAFVASLKKMQEGQDGRFPELRSIAWDFNGLPKKVYLYHSVTAKTPEGQASRFRNALAAAETKAELMSLKEENAKLTPAVQQAVVKRILESMKPAS